MNDRLLNDKKIIEDDACELWKGHNVDIDTLNQAIQDASTIILDVVGRLDEEDRNTTIVYIKKGLEDYNTALDKADDFIMADCLYYTWLEMINIYLEMLLGV